MNTPSASLYQQFTPGRALSLAEAKAMGEQEIIDRLAVVLRQVTDRVIAARDQILWVGADYLYIGTKANPLTGETHRCVRGNFGFWSYWMRDELLALACTLHVVKLTDEEFWALDRPQGYTDSSAALCAMRGVPTACRMAA